MASNRVQIVMVLWVTILANAAGAPRNGPGGAERAERVEVDERCFRAKLQPNPSEFMVVGNDEGQVWYIPFDEGGNFGSKSLIAGLSDPVRGVSVFDSDNDGDLDFVAMVLAGGETDLFVFENDGSNAFAESRIYETIPPAQVPFWHGLSYITASDFNGDSYVDFVLSSADSRPTDLYLFVNDSGSGSFSQFFLETANWATHAAKMGAGDFDGDGNADFVIYDYEHAGDFQAEVYVYLGDGGCGFTPVHVFTTQHAVHAITAGDFDNDGDLDVVVGLDDDGDPGQAWLYRGNGDGTFSQVGEEVFDLDPGHELGSDWDEGHGNADVYDFDRDGNMDVIATAIGEPAGHESKVYFIRGYGDGTFPRTPDEMLIVAQDLGINYPVSAPVLLLRERLGSISGHKFYDSNVNGVRDGGEVGLAGWSVILEGRVKDSICPPISVASETDERPRSRLSGRGYYLPIRQAVQFLAVDSAYTDTGGYYGFIDLEPGTYRVKEVIPEPQPVWVPTTPTEYSVTVESGQNVTGIDFGNLVLGQVGARTIGYWKNHLERITPDMYAALEVLPAFAGCGNPDSVLAILSPPWPDMAAKLRAQLLAMTFNVLSGMVSGDGVVYLCDDVLAAELLFGLPAPSFKQVQEVLDAVELAYDWSGWTHSEQEAVKDLLDRMNNDLLFVLPGPPGGHSLPRGTDDGSCADGRSDVSPVGFHLSQNVPNPFSSFTVISYYLPSHIRVCLNIYDVGGRLVRTLVDGESKIGLHLAQWDGKAEDGRALPRGVYLYQMKRGRETTTRKMVLLR